MSSQNRITTQSFPASKRITIPRASKEAQEAVQTGVDIALLEDNLNRTHEQRIENHERARALIYERNLGHLLEADDVIVTQDLRFFRCKDGKITNILTAP